MVVHLPAFVSYFLFLNLLFIFYFCWKWYLSRPLIWSLCQFDHHLVFVTNFCVKTASFQECTLNRHHWSKGNHKFNIFWVKDLECQKFVGVKIITRLRFVLLLSEPRVSWWKPSNVKCFLKLFYFDEFFRVRLFSCSLIYAFLQKPIHIFVEQFLFPRG